MTTILSGSQVSPSGDPGPLPPAAVSADTGNIATLGSDNLILVPQQTIWYQALRAFNSLGNSTFEINQRLQPASGSWNCDRWQSAGNLVANCTSIVAGQATPGPLYAPGTSFRLSNYMISVTLNTQKATLVTSDAYYITQGIEGIQIRELGGDVHSVTLAVYTSVAGLKFGVCIRDVAAAWSLTYLCTVPNANQWTFITLPSCPIWTSNATFSNQPGVLGYNLFITLAAGPSFINPGSGPPGGAVWTAGNLIGATGQDNFMSKPVGSVFYLGFAQHQPGPPTNVIDSPWLQNYDMCQRYYQKAINYGIAPCQGNWKQIGSCINGSTAIRCNIQFPKRMAKNPTVRMVGNSAVLNNVYIDGPGLLAIAAPGGNETGINAVTLTAATTAATGTGVLGEWDADTGW